MCHYVNEMNERTPSLNTKKGKISQTAWSIKLAVTYCAAGNICDCRGRPIADKPFSPHPKAQARLEPHGLKVAKVGPTSSSYPIACLQNEQGP